MIAKFLDGKVLAQTIRENLKNEVQKIKDTKGSFPTLISILIGNDQGSLSYVASQKKVAEYIGIHYDLVNFPSTIAHNDLIQCILGLNSEARVHGIIVQKPVPSQIDYAKIISSIDPSKDVEGMNLANIGKMILGGNRLVPCTAASVMEHIQSTGVDLRGKEAVVIGRSDIVGKPVIHLLLEKNLTVTVCHSATDPKKLIEHIGRADVVVAAVGKPAFVKGEWIKEGAIVIDVGINKVISQIVGDVEFDVAKNRASFITPVPGGVGPLTVVMLMRNCIEAFKFQRQQGVGVTI